MYIPLIIDAAKALCIFKSGHKREDADRELAFLTEFVHKIRNGSTEELCQEIEQFILIQRECSTAEEASKRLRGEAHRILNGVEEKAD